MANTNGMSIDDILDEAAELCRLQNTATVDRPRLVRWYNEVMMWLATEYDFWFWQTDFSATISVSTRTIAFPTTDVYGNTNINMVKAVRDSFRASTSSADDRITLVKRQVLDRLTSRRWLNTNQTGSPKYITVAGGEQFQLDKIPDSTYIGSGRTLYWTGYRTPVHITTADVLTTSFPDMPRHFHWLIPIGMQWYGWQRQGSPMWVQKKQEFLEEVERVKAKDYMDEDGTDSPVQLPRAMTLR